MTQSDDPMAKRRWRRLAEMAQHAMDGPQVPSPCQSVCVMHPGTGWCEGCLRSLEEIAQWSRMEASAKRAVWAQLPMRMAQGLQRDATPSGPASDRASA